jgi:hypothetical protein
MPRGYIQGFRLGGATDLTFKCSLSSVIYCGSLTTGVDIISVSEDPITRASFLLFEVPAGLPEGEYDAYVTTPAGIITGQYDYGQGLRQLGPATISGVIPSSGIGGNEVLVTGRNLFPQTGFFDGTKAYFNTPGISVSGIPLTIDSDSWDITNGDQLRFSVPETVSLSGYDNKYESAVSGTIDYEIVLSNRYDQWHTGVGHPFKVIPPPYIKGFSPASGLTGETITVSGANYINVSSIGFGGYIHASGFVVNGITGIENDADTVISSGEIQFKVPDSLVGDNRIHIVATGGGATSSEDFKLLMSPVSIDDINPPLGRRGDYIILSGARMPSALNVDFSGENETESRINSTSFKLLNNRAIGVNVPNDAIDGEIRVTNEGGSTSSANEFNVIFDAAVQSMTPLSGRYSDVITVSGLNLSGAEFFFRNADGVTDANTLKGDNLIYTNETGATFQVPKETFSSQVYVSGIAGNAFYYPDIGNFTVIPTIEGVTLKNPSSPNTIRFAATQFCVSGINAIRSLVLGYTGNNKAGGVSLGRTDIFLNGDSGDPPTYTYPGYSYFSGVLPYDADTEYFESGYFALIAEDPIFETSTPEAQVSALVSGRMHFLNEIGHLDGILFKDEKYQLLPPLPTINSFSPKFGYQNTSVSVEGYSLSQITGVMFSGFDSFPSVSGFADNLIISDDYSLSFNPPYSFSGSGHLLAENIVGEIAVSTGIFTNVRPMRVDGVFPVAGQPFRSFTISGDNLDFVKTIKFGDFEITGFTAYRVC